MREILPLHDKLRTVAPGAADRFGSSVALTQAGLAVVAPGDSSDPRPYANPQDDFLAASGAV